MAKKPAAKKPAAKKKAAPKKRAPRKKKLVTEMTDDELRADGMTPQQEQFAELVVSGGMTQIDAYREAYKIGENERSDWHYVEANQLLQNPKISLRVKDLREAAANSAIYNHEMAFRELEAARAMAEKLANPAGMVRATREKLKLMGLDKPKKLDVTGRILVDPLQAAIDEVQGGDDIDDLGDLADDG